MITISGLTYAASAPALLRFALRVAARAQGWLPAGWLAFTGRASNPLDRYERFQIVVILLSSSPDATFPCFLTVVLSTRRLPSLLRVPPSMVPRSRRYYEGATTSYWRISGNLFVSLPPPT
jgi:hypothetical protein